MELIIGTKSELVALVETSGLEQTKQNQIAETLGVFFNKAAEWDNIIQDIVITSPTETGKMKMAKEGRLTLKNMRLEAEKIVKAKRDEVKYAMANFVLEDKLWLKAGQMMEATFKNLETKLEEKEKFAERWEAEQKEKLKAKRLEELLPLGFQLGNGFDLGNMDEAMFQSLKLGLETAKKEKEEAERKAEEERIAKEKAEAEARAKMEAENKRLKAETEAREKQLQAERAKAEVERKALEEKARKEKAIADAKLKAERAKAEVERKALEEKARKEKAIADAKLKAEREANEKLQAEIRAKAEAEEKAKKDAELKAAAELKAKQKAEDDAAKAPIKKQLLAWVDSFSIGKPLTENAISLEIERKFESFKDWAKSKI